MPSIEIWGYRTWTHYGSLSPGEVRELFELDLSCDPEIRGFEGWNTRGGRLYYALEIDEKITICLID